MSRDRDRREARVNPPPAPASPSQAPDREPGPVDEKWAYAPGVTPEDITAAEQWCRAENSSSPIHMVAARYMIWRMRPDLTEEQRRQLWDKTLAAVRRRANGWPEP